MGPAARCLGDVSPLHLDPATFRGAVVLALSDFSHCRDLDLHARASLLDPAFFRFQEAPSKISQPSTGKALSWLLLPHQNHPYSSCWGQRPPEMCTSCVRVAAVLPSSNSKEHLLCVSP